MKKLFAVFIEDNLLYVVVTDNYTLYRLYNDGSICPADAYDVITAKEYGTF